MQRYTCSNFDLSKKSISAQNKTVYHFLVLLKILDRTYNHGFILSIHDRDSQTSFRVFIIFYYESVTYHYLLELFKISIRLYQKN